MSRFVIAVVGVIISCGVLTARPSAAQEFPSKTVRMVVPWPPGGLVDIAARAVAKELQTGMGQPVVVDNKPGAGGVIGADIVAKSAPDGYTLALTTSALNMNAALGQKLPFDVSADFIPVAAVAFAPSVVVVNNKVAARTIGELITLARNQPGKLSYASAGIGSPAHLSAELLKSMMGLEITHVPYKGAPQAMTDLVAGHVDLLFANAAVALPQIRSGAVRPLAVTGAKRFAVLPDLPTVAEAGVKDFEADQWLGVLLPRGTPPAIANRYRGEINKALASDALRASLTSNGMSVAEGESQAQFAEYVRAELVKWVQVVKVANIKPE